MLPDGAVPSPPLPSEPGSPQSRPSAGSPSTRHGRRRRRITRGPPGPGHPQGGRWPLGTEKSQPWDRRTRRQPHTLQTAAPHTAQGPLGAYERREKIERGLGVFGRGVGTSLWEVTVAPGRRSFQGRVPGHASPNSRTGPLPWRDRQEDGEGWEGAKDGALVPAGPVEPGSGLGRSLGPGRAPWERTSPGLLSTAPRLCRKRSPVPATVRPHPQGSPSGRLGAAGQGPGEGAWHPPPRLEARAVLIPGTAHNYS